MPGRMDNRDPSERSAIRRQLKRLRRSYVVMLFNRRTFEDKGAIQLTPLRSILILIGSFLLVGALFFSAFAFTPLKRYLPGYPGKLMEERSIQAIAKADSLEEELELMKAHFQRMRSVFSRFEKGDTAEKSLKEGALGANGASPRDDGKRRERRGDEYLFPPLRGSITDPFDQPGHHFGVDLTAEEGSPIKATLEGTVVFASWTPKGGNVLGIQHPNGLFSIYKHNAALLKKEGQKVRTGEVIAIIGNTGEWSSGPHLHFELWRAGDPVDPEKVLLF